MHPRRLYELDLADRRDILELLGRSPAEHVYLLWRVAEGALDPYRSHEFFYGARVGAERRLVAIVGVGANLVPAGDDLEALEDLGEMSASMTSKGTVRMLIGERDRVTALWEGFRRAGEFQTRLDTLHTYHEVREDQIPEGLGLPELIPAPLELADQIEEASAAMLLEDLGRTDREDDPKLFRRRIELAIKQSEIFCSIVDGQVVFKLNLGARTRDTVQLQGVYTAPEWRGRGLCRRGCAELARRLFHRGVKTVNLFVREENQAARAAYQAAGFVPRHTMRMIVL